MKLSCPGCGAIFSLDALIGNEGAREAVMAAMQMPAPLGWLMIRYVALFRPAQRQLSLDRVANLLNDLLPMIDEVKIERNGRCWSAPQVYWKQAIEEMLTKRDTLALPLKSHGYLLAIIEGYNLKSEQRKEQQHEDKLAGRTPAAIPAAYQPSQDVLNVINEKPRSVMPESVKQDLQRLKMRTYEPPPQATPASPEA